MLSVLLVLHLAAAAAALVAFWIAAFAFKGGPPHRAAGVWFARLIYLAAIAGGLLAIIGLVRPSLLALSTVPGSDARHERHLLYLIVYLLAVVVAPVQHGIAVVAAGPVPARLRSKLHLILNSGLVLIAFVMFPLGIVWGGWPFVLVAPAGFVIGLRNMRYASRSAAVSAEWEREHLTSLITGGIAVHTAFFALTAIRWPQLLGGGAWDAAPWLVPAAVGLPVIARLRARRR